MDREVAEQWMREALAEAHKAECAGEIPVGAVVLVNDKIVGRGHNHTIQSHDPSAHAEIMALRHAARGMRNHRLPGSIVIVTVEPCVMCAGAMIQARVDTVIYGAADPKAGALDSHFHLAGAPHLNHRFQVVSGILASECGSLLRSFFAARRTACQDPDTSS
jgi:tRNA(adenine34) deaminase